MISRVEHRTPEVASPRILVLLLLSVMIVGVSRDGWAQEKETYKPMGAPSDPKVEAHWNRFHDHGMATKLMKDLTAAYPKLSSLESLGKSYGGLDMWIWTITNTESGDTHKKPAFYIDGGIHANELQGPDVVLYTGWFLLEMYGRNDFITELLDRRTLYLVPIMSPDSREAHMYRPNTTSSPRSGQRPIDDDRDGQFDEDPPEDINGDGSIQRMRVVDPNGNYKEHEKYPNLLVRVEPGEQGKYRMLGSEGYDNDGDGRVNEDGDGYYDPNRDWAWNWQPKHVQRGSYRYPFSIPENRLVADFVMDHPNIAGAQSYHNSGGMILRGPGSGSEAYERQDVRLFDVIGKKGESMLPGYRYLITHKDLYTVFGGELDWFYAMRGAITYTNELWTSFNYFRKKSGDDGFIAGRELQHVFDKYLLFGEGIAEWKEFDHPQYGKVEIGGFTKQWRRQPPSFLIEEECHRNMAFTLYHADQMPMVDVQDVSTKDLGSGLTQVTARVANARMIPTRLQVDVKNHISPSDLVTVTAEDIEVLAGMTSSAPYFETVREQKLDPARLQLARIRGMTAVYCRWIVKGKGPFTVTIRSTKGGTASRTSE
ncbi:MAG: M14 family metallopeptidase [Planctomycetota bacterium]|nr:M14 family metallopeptidase [Planctomycetota bacterium]